MAITFDLVPLLQLNLYFRKALIITFQMMYFFVWFSGDPNFPIVFSNDVIVTS